MKKHEELNKDNKCLESMSRRFVMQKAFYSTPKLLLLGVMIVAPQDASASGPLGEPPDPPADQSAFNNGWTNG